MTMNHSDIPGEPTRAEIDALPGPLLLEFGAGWCGYCRAAQPLIAEAIAEYPQFRHIKVEDGKGRRLGRSFQVKLWPTLIVLDNGSEVARVVRPASSHAISEILAQMAPVNSR